jgi:hypothetical protein
VSRPQSNPREPQQLALLRRVVSKRNPELLALLSTLASRPLTSEEREMLRGSVLTEFLEIGLQADDEPTGYGLALQGVIDWLGHV